MTWVCFRCMLCQTVSAASQAAVFRSSVSPNIVPKQVQTGIIYPGLSGTIWTSQLQPPLSKWKHPQHFKEHCWLLLDLKNTITNVFGEAGCLISHLLYIGGMYERPHPTPEEKEHKQWRDVSHRHGSILQVEFQPTWQGCVIVEEKLESHDSGCDNS